jgi:hypothetical protein
MKHLMVVILLCNGCSAWNEAQIGLTTQARRGVVNLVKRTDTRQQAALELAKLRRQRLDDAFDQDVRERQSFDADWIIQHRKAYAAGLDAYSRQQSAEEAALQSEKRDLAAIDAALERLLWLQSIQAKFDILGEVTDGTH